MKYANKIKQYVQLSLENSINESDIDVYNKQVINLINKYDPTFFNRCEKSRRCDISFEFLGFVDVYYHLSKIIPRTRIIIDFGCAYATQAVYFINHKQYIGIDINETVQVQTPNSVYYNKGIKHFIDETFPLLSLEQKNIFAICSYVPPWYNDNEALVRANFQHLFVYYP
ncbi:MAG: hypothetical protein PHF86_14630 [Candidatus Nanoarchaeia archaeon]|nr:hypothetical protein [Candidatus Nanoarchaeia archaeon]